MRDVHDYLVVGRTAYEIRYGVPSDGLLMLVGAEIAPEPITPEDEARMHQYVLNKRIFWNRHGLCAGGWSGD